MDKRAVAKIIELMIVLCEIEGKSQDFDEKVNCEVNNPNSDDIIDE